jgi:hypothetical protein
MLERQGRDPGPMAIGEGAARDHDRAGLRVRQHREGLRELVGTSLQLQDMQLDP